jgi:hypothetical protein
MPSHPANNLQPFGLMAASLGNLFSAFQPPSHVHQARFRMFPDNFAETKQNEGGVLQGDTNFILKDSDCQLMPKPIGKRPCVVQCSSNVLGNLFQSNPMVKSIQNAVGGVVNLFVPNFPING